MAKVEGLSDKYCSKSAGIIASYGDPASDNSIQVLRDTWNLDINGHIATRVSLSDVEEAYLILTMTKAHLSTIVYLFPQFAQKMYTLRQYTADSLIEVGDSEDINLDISDPYGMSLETYKSCASEIKTHVDKVVIKLMKADNTLK